MESANLHHQQQLHQEQFVESSSLSTPSFYGSSGDNNSWNPNLISNAGDLNLNVNGFLSNSRGSRQNNVNYLVPPSINTSMIQDLGYHHWISSTGNFTNQSAHELHLARIKEELSESPHRFSETINCLSSNPEEFHLPSTSYIKERRDLNDLSEKILLKTFSSGCQLNDLQDGTLYSNSQSSVRGTATSTRGNFSQIFPSANVSTTNSPFSSMNMQVLDLLTSTKSGGGFGQLRHNNLGLFKETPSFDLDHMKESSHWLTSSSNKVSSFANEVTETKRSSSVMEPKASNTASKKPRFESRASLAPFKVRKEKLGDRIAALQQLVAPFGKTDTASVLMEAIGYIKFLQDQVETLSVPYMKSLCNNSARSIHKNLKEGDDEDTKRDLRSRGLCLVPMSCISYIASDNIGGWLGSDYGGRT
ncbi:hypothetical protein IFM89_016566 [Coptis chinensis]|uniref:BHLH domain-containing protein n=1 Tax=Coptis chinensis TaxID=261450 RepID=A0A835I0J2_9MAGN|nr:hypothetical protein IFM89_016566 [Coptis chinensis]